MNNVKTFFFDMFKIHECKFTNYLIDAKNEINT
jgi:hypothetical protein